MTLLLQSAPSEGYQQGSAAAASVSHLTLATWVMDISYNGHGACHSTNLPWLHDGQAYPGIKQCSSASEG